MATASRGKGAMVPGIFPQLTVRTERKKWQLAFSSSWSMITRWQLTRLSLSFTLGLRQRKRWDVVVERKCCGCGEVVQRKWNGEEWRYLGIKKEEEMVYGFGEEFECTRWLRIELVKM